MHDVMPASSRMDELVGLPRCSTKNYGGNNCWTVASVAILASDPLIGAFVRDVWHQSADFSAHQDKGDRAFKESRCSGLRAYCAEFSEKNVYTLAVSLIRCIAISIMTPSEFGCTGGSTDPEFVTYKYDAAEHLYAQKMAGGHDHRDGMADAVHDGFYQDSQVIQQAMLHWWEQALYSMYDQYGISVRLARLTMCHGCMRHRDPNKDECDSILPLVVTAPADKGDRPIHLEHIINHNKLNTHTAPDRPIHGHDDKGCGPVTSHTLLLSLPWRFAVHIDRRRGGDPNSSDMAAQLVGPVCYNTESLTIGATTKGCKWAEYRLVARASHRSAHWVADILDEKTLTYKRLSFDTVTDAPLDIRDGLCFDYESTLLVFEKCRSENAKDD